MLKSDVIQFFGSQAAVGRELGIGKAAVSKWPEKVPRPWAAELHVRTNGRLRFDPAEYDGKDARATDGTCDAAESVA